MAQGDDNMGVSGKWKGIGDPVKSTYERDLCDCLPVRASPDDLAHLVLLMSGESFPINGLYREQSVHHLGGVIDIGETNWSTRVSIQKINVKLAFSGSIEELSVSGFDGHWFNFLEVDKVGTIRGKMMASTTIDDDSTQ